MKPIPPKSTIARVSQALRRRQGGTSCPFPATRRVLCHPSFKSVENQVFRNRALFSSSPSPKSKNNDDGFLTLWRDRVAQGMLHQDKAQEKAAKRLHRLQQALVGYSNEEFFRPRPEPKTEQENDDNGKGGKEKLEKGTEKETKPTRQESHEGPKPNQSEQIPPDSQQEPPKDDNKTKEELPPPPPPPPLPQVPRGLYIWGPVGTGKSLLMDTFYSVVDESKKQRFHFHAFMADVHARIHTLNQQDLKQKGRNFHVDTTQDHNPIIRVALQLSQETTLLCLDEFQVTDVADAMILSQLFDVLFQHGTVVVATSNRPPQGLYEGGLNRSYFLPFLDVLSRHCIVHSLESSFGDYRKMLSSMEYNNNNNNNNRDDKKTVGDGNNSILLEALPIKTGPFFFQHDATTTAQTNQLDDIVQNLMDQVYSVGNDNSDNNLLLKSFDLKAGFGRTITVDFGDPNGLIGRFQFEQLCDRDYGASDYRAVANHFSIIALESIPTLSTFHHNRARRFITLIDELYEAKCALVCSTTEAGMDSPDDLFLTTGRKRSDQKGDDSVPVVGETLGIEDVQTQGGQPVSSLASVRELSFAFLRAASRLTEMTSKRWWNQVLQADGWKKSPTDQ